MKRTTWQIWFVFTALMLTVFYLFPTIVYYARPLTSKIDQNQADRIAKSAIARAQNYEGQTLCWIKDLCKRLGEIPEKIEWTGDDPQLIHIRCKSNDQASMLRAYLQRAGANVPIDVAQVALVRPGRDDDPLDITLARKIRYHLSNDQVGQALQFVEKSDRPESPYYRRTSARVDALKEVIFQDHPLQKIVERCSIKGPTLADQLRIAESVLPFLRESSNKEHQTTRFWRWLFCRVPKPTGAYRNLRKTAQLSVDEAQSALRLLEKHRSEEQALDRLLDEDQLQQLNEQKQRLQTLENFAQYLNAFDEELLQRVAEKGALRNVHPFISHLTWQFQSGTADAFYHQDHIEAISDGAPREKWFVQELARIREATGESLTLTESGFTVPLDLSSDSPDALFFDLGNLAHQEIAHMHAALQTHWKPKHPELSGQNFPIFDVNTYEKTPALARQFCLVVVAPCLDASPFTGLKADAIYVIAKNLHQLQAGTERAQDQQRTLFERDIESLSQILGMRGYLFNEFAEQLDPQLQKSCVFELPDFARTYLEATRESFQILGQERFARLPLGSHKQRLREVNRIENGVQEDLLKWRDEYRQANVALNSAAQFQVPAPLSNAHLENLRLSWRKYWRGDPDRVLKWGLDLSGGKCVRIGLYDARGRQVTDYPELEQAREELYARVNALGVSEVAIRIDGVYLTLDFPGSQDLSATDLVQASSMRFHVVNEKFGPDHPVHGDLVNEFLKGVWNEALVTGEKDLAALNAIARRHLQRSDEAEGSGQNSAADQLRKLGLKLADESDLPTANFDETRSIIAPFRGTDSRDWYRQAHPLIIIFENFALEGTDLEDIRTRFEPSEGYALNFSVKKRLRADQSSPRQTLHEWTYQFAKDQIAGTPRGADRPGRGWRMAVLLQSSVISAPELPMPLSDRASISGHFSQRDIQKLATDLRAGSLTFQPEILSEETISPQLGLRDRTKGIAAAIAGFFGVITVMVVTYRFAGVVASVALAFNLLIICAILQELGAAITLPGIAGIVLTMGMAVDANVLIFERIREELQTLSPANALKVGFRRALPAILDSNVTTILAALILIQFDLGPIKGFAVTLIAGLISSMFTAVFATHAFLQYWVAAKGTLGHSLHQKWTRFRFDTLALFRLALGLSALLLTMGGLAAWQQRHSLLSIDFTGGTSVTLEVALNDSANPVRRVEQALNRCGLHFGQFRVRQLESPRHLRVDLSSGLDAPGQPLANLFPEAEISGTPFPPKLRFIVDALEGGDVRLTSECLRNLPKQWGTTSSQFSSAMRTRAFTGLTCALLLSLVYLAVRFNARYALAAILALSHALILTLSAASILHAAHLPIEINLYVLGALMTIIGYCLNDMIILFDRIREERKLDANRAWKETITLAIERTFTRTLMTCGTTLVSLIFLIAFGGESLFAFSTVMAIGVLFGTLSSLFIAAPILLMLVGDTRPKARRSKPGVTHLP